MRPIRFWTWFVEYVQPRHQFWLEFWWSPRQYARSLMYIEYYSAYSLSWIQHLYLQIFGRGRRTS